MGFIAKGLFNLLLHLKAWLKDHDFARRDRDDLAGARVPSCAALPLFKFKDSEITQLNLLSPDQGFHDAVKALLDDLFHIYLLQVGLVRYL